MECRCIHAQVRLCCTYKAVFEGRKNSTCTPLCCAPSNANGLVFFSHSSRFIAETLGMSIVVSIGNGAITNEVLKRTKGHNLGLGFVAIAWGMSFFTAIIMFGHISAMVSVYAFCFWECQGERFRVVPLVIFLWAFRAFRLLRTSYGTVRCSTVGDDATCFTSWPSRFVFSPGKRPPCWVRLIARMTFRTPW